VLGGLAFGVTVWALSTLVDDLPVITLLWFLAPVAFPLSGLTGHDLVLRLWPRPDAGGYVGWETVAAGYAAGVAFSLLAVVGVFALLLVAGAKGHSRLYRVVELGCPLWAVAGRALSLRLLRGRGEAAPMLFAGSIVAILCSYLGLALLAIASVSGSD